MTRRRLIELLILPSFSSGLVVVGLSLAVAGTSGWSYISRNQLFYDYLFGVHGITTLLLQAPDSTAIFQQAIFNNPGVYHIIILLGGLIAGLVVFTALEGVSRIRRETVYVLHELHDERAAAIAEIKDLFGRLGLRVVSVTAWAIYILFFTGTFLPFCILLTQLGIDDILASTSYGSAYVAASILCLGIGLHVHIIFARLCALRPRLFGGLDIEMAALDER